MTVTFARRSRLPVYVIENSDVYHTGLCRALARSEKAVTVRLCEALESGRRACLNCQHERKGLTPLEHRARHVELHRALDELMADWAAHHPGKLFSNSTIAELMEWSHRQTIAPDEFKEE